MVQAQRLFKGQITFGDVTQSSSAFNSVHDSLSFFRSVYDSFAAYRAVIIRLDGLVETNQQARALPHLKADRSHDGALELHDIEVRNPAGLTLLQGLNLRLKPGESVVITGRSGSGKTTLLRSLALLWPFTEGTLSWPAEDRDTMFLSQVPYLPLGDLRAVLSYPDAESDISDEQLLAVLDDVTLGHLSNRLNETQDWANVLSPGNNSGLPWHACCYTGRS